MYEIIIGIFILIILAAVFLSGRKQKIAHAKVNKTTKRAERESWTQKSVMSFGQINQFREELIKSMEEKFADHPEQMKQLKEIINDWADLKIQSFQERRSWVRKPDQTKK